MKSLAQMKAQMKADCWALLTAVQMVGSWAQMKAGTKALTKLMVKPKELEHLGREFSSLI